MYVCFCWLFWIIKGIKECITGTFALKNNDDNELEIIIETAKGKYRKDLVYLNDYTMYVVEDVSGADVDKYHYEINFLPKWGAKITHKQ